MSYFKIYNSKMGVYVIWTREFMRNKEQIYKVGRTSNLKERLNNYGKGSVVLFYQETSQNVRAESKCLEICRLKFQQRTEFGKEYFEGNVNEIIRALSHVLVDFPFEVDGMQRENQRNHVENNTCQLNDETMTNSVEESSNIESESMANKQLTNVSIIKTDPSQRRNHTTCKELLTPTGRLKKIHTCLVCHYETPYIHNMKKHVNLKTPCGNNEQDINFIKMKQMYLEGDRKIQQDWHCKSCLKQFTCRTSVYKHKCKITRTFVKPDTENIQLLEHVVERTVKEKLSELRNAFSKTALDTNK